MKDLTSKFARLDAITAELGTIEPRRDNLRKEAAELTVALLKAEAPPTEVAKRSPFSAAHVRHLARVAGLPPAPPGGRSRKAAK
jgi:hypothetical protein